MSISRRRAAIALAAMSGAAALAYAGVPTKKVADTWETNLKEMFPPTFGNWRVDDSVPVILPAPDVQALLDELYNQVLARTYVNAKTGYRIMFTVAYGGDQSDGTKAHLPEVCYPAQGFQVLDSSRLELEFLGRAVPVKRLVTKLGSRNEPLTYWLTIGESVSASILDRKLAQMEYGLRGYIPDGMLIRVSSIDRETAQAFDEQVVFLRDMAAGVPAQHRDRIFGKASA